MLICIMVLFSKSSNHTKCRRERIECRISIWLSNNKWKTQCLKKNQPLKCEIKMETDKRKSIREI
jgi:hypothetical protein